MTSISRTAVVTACLAVLAVGAGCGSDDDSSSSSTASSGGTSTTSKSSATADLKGQKLTFVNYGGDSMNAAQKGWLDPFSQKTGVQFATDQPTDPAKLQAQLKASKLTWDNIDIDPSVGGAMCAKGQMRTRTEMGVDTSTIPKKYITDDCGVPIIIQAVALIYNKDKFGDNPPTKISDFLDTAKYPGKRMIFNYFLGSMEPLEMAMGVPPENIYPFKYDVVKQAYDKVKGSLNLNNELAQQAQGLESGNFALCLCYTGRAALAAQKGANIGVVWDHTWLAWDGLYAPKGSKSPEAQAEFMKYIATGPGQAPYSNYLAYGPTPTDAKPNPPAEFDAYLPAGHEAEMNGPGLVKYKYTATVSEEANKFWTELTSG